VGFNLFGILKGQWDKRGAEKKRIGQGGRTAGSKKIHPRKWVEEELCVKNSLRKPVELQYCPRRRKFLKKGKHKDEGNVKEEGETSGWADRKLLQKTSLR